MSRNLDDEHRASTSWQANYKRAEHTPEQLNEHIKNKRQHSQKSEIITIIDDRRKV